MQHSNIDSTVDETNRVQQQCPICFNGIKKGVELPCGHVYDDVCIVEWFIETRGTGPCPVCRDPVEFRLAEPDEISTPPPLRLTSYSLVDAPDAIYVLLRS